MSANEDLNRLRRAILLADLMQAWRIDSRKVAVNISAADRKMAADGVRALGFDFNGIPSDDTWREVVRLLEQRERMAAEMAKRGGMTVSEIITEAKA